MRDNIKQSTVNRRLRVIDARSDALARLSEQVDEQLYPPGGVQARSLSEWVAVGEAILRLIQWCYQSQQTLDAIDNLLTNYGSSLSAEERERYNDLGERIWEERVRRGCP